MTVCDTSVWCVWTGWATLGNGPHSLRYHSSSPLDVARAALHNGRDTVGTSVHENGGTSEKHRVHIRASSVNDKEISVTPHGHCRRPMIISALGVAVFYARGQHEIR